MAQDAGPGSRAAPATEKTMPPTEHLFVVRLWLESGTQSSISHWRGSVQHVISGQQVYFASLRDMNDFIALKTGQVLPEGGVVGVASPDPRSKE